MSLATPPPLPPHPVPVHYTLKEIPDQYPGTTAEAVENHRAALENAITTGKLTPTDCDRLYEAFHKYISFKQWKLYRNGPDPDRKKFVIRYLSLYLPPLFQGPYDFLNLLHELVYVFGVRLDLHKSGRREGAMWELFQVYVKCGWLTLEDLIELAMVFHLREDRNHAVTAKTILEVVTRVLGEYLYRDITEFYRPRPFTKEHLLDVMAYRYQLNQKRPLPIPDPPPLIQPPAERYPGNTDEIVARHRAALENAIATRQLSEDDGRRLFNAFKGFESLKHRRRLEQLEGTEWYNFVTTCLCEYLPPSFPGPYDFINLLHELVYVFGVRLEKHKKLSSEMCLDSLFQTYVACGLLWLEDLADLGRQCGLQENIDYGIQSDAPVAIVSLVIAAYLTNDITQFYQPRPFTIDHLRRVMMERHRLNVIHSLPKPPLPRSDAAAPP
jgi:hypothetical protein